MEFRGKPLAFRENNRDLGIGPNSPLVYEDGSDSPVTYNTCYYKHNGRPFLRKGLPVLQWSAETDRNNISELAECHCFSTGLLISPRIRAVIENYDDTNIEFIPLKVKQERTGKHFADWWYCNVYNWKEAFDFEKSDVDWVDMPILRDTYHGPLRLISEFSNKVITNIRRLEVLPSALEGGLYLARAPTETICLRLFVGHELGREIVAKVNETAPLIDQIRLEVFDPPSRPDYPQPPSGGGEVQIEKPPSFKGSSTLRAWLKSSLGRWGAPHQK